MISIGVQTKNVVYDSDPAAGYEMLKKAGFSCADFSLNSYLPNFSLYQLERNDFFDRSEAELEQHFLPHKKGAEAAGIVINQMGYEYALGGFVAVGFCGCILAFVVYKFGTKWIDIVLPPAAMGPVVALIGLELSGSAAQNAGLLDAEIDGRKVIVFLVTLGIAVFGNILFRGFLSVIPILIAVIAGYVAALVCGIVDFAEVAAAPFFTIPNFQAPKFNMEAILIILPVILVITSEHIGHQVVTSKVVGRDLLNDPGLHRSLFGDNFSTMLSGCIGSVPTTTYGENIGVMAVTGVYSVYVIAGAALLSVICSFSGKLSALISTVPGPVIGGISFLLYGMIGTSGLRILVDSKVDYGNSRNLSLTSVIFVTGLSGIALKLGISS